MNMCVLTVFLVQFFYVNCWVFNDIGIEAIKRSNFDNEYDSNKLELLEPTSIEIDDQNLNLKIALIYPGTRWCGPGDIANNVNEIGSEWRADLCCRDHDHCDDIIHAGETKYNLTNDAFYTRLSCSCDETFRKCLKSANSVAADNIGILYFNALGTKCYRNDYPVMRCIKTGGWLNKKCLVYSYDTTAEKIYQWFDVNIYR